MRRLRTYLSVFRIRFIHSLQYRAAAYAGVATQFAWGGMTLLMFWAFYKDSFGANGTGGAPTSIMGGFPMDFAQLSSYIWLQQALLSLFMGWSFDNSIFDDITHGNIAYELCRPFDLYSIWFTKNMATRCSRALLRCLPIFAIAVFLPYPFALSAPVSLTAFGLFLLSGLLGFLLMISFVMLIYICAFYTLSPGGIRILATSAIDFLSGMIIPLPFFPQKLGLVISLLPFASMQNTPLMIYNGFLSGPSITRGLLLQGIWLLVLIGGGRLLMHNALKRVVVQGG